MSLPATPPRLERNHRLTIPHQFRTESIARQYLRNDHTLKSFLNLATAPSRRLVQVYVLVAKDKSPLRHLLRQPLHCEWHRAEVAPSSAFQARPRRDGHPRFCVYRG